ncbi:MAG: hypothetical protein K8F62_10400 [Pseudorhodoplanes sp.]|nr:hypothetical protein [Pseudorhodoplanes sp.]
MSTAHLYEIWLSNTTPCRLDPALRTMIDRIRADAQRPNAVQMAASWLISLLRGPHFHPCNGWLAALQRTRCPQQL